MSRFTSVDREATEHGVMQTQCKKMGPCTRELKSNCDYGVEEGESCGHGRVGGGTNELGEKGERKGMKGGRNTRNRAKKAKTGLPPRAVTPGRKASGCCMGKGHGKLQHLLSKQETKFGHAFCLPQPSVLSSLSWLCHALAPSAASASCCPTQATSRSDAELYIYMLHTQSFQSHIAEFGEL